MHQLFTLNVYFFYGLAFFSMGLLAATEGGRSSDLRLRTALRPLAGFGVIHAAHEWLEMFRIMGHLDHIPGGIYPTLTLSLLTLSFLSLAAFGAYLAFGDETTCHCALTIPLGMAVFWGLGYLILREKYPNDLFFVADAWTRYALGIPSSLLAAAGLAVQQRAFQKAGLVRYGRDSFFASVAFVWFGLVGQLFVEKSSLPPSTWINSLLFLRSFGFSVQFLRAVSAAFASFFVIRFLRAFQVENDAKIAELQAARLRESQQREKLRVQLFRRIVAAQEAERQRIARDLHDETGQSLTAIGMGLRALSNEEDLQKRRNTLTQLQSLASDSILELQRVISDLRPAHLDDLGLSAAARWYAARIHERTGLQTTVSIEGDEPALEDSVKIAVFRIMQEALTNIVKHAQATKAQIRIGYLPQEIRVAINDDGVGFDADAIRVRVGRVSFGLAGMEERAALLGGGVRVSSRPNFGTEIEASAPLHWIETEE
ncbi:MAG: sensor histidine kinase [Anaerolineales bacterium]|nr:sensor histidine kinase [Anaerolineales bacterium]